MFRASNVTGDGRPYIDFRNGLAGSHNLLHLVIAHAQGAQLFICRSGLNISDAFVLPFLDAPVGNVHAISGKRVELQ